MVFPGEPSADLSSRVKQPSIFFASVSVSVHAALPYRETDSNVERNSRVLVFLESIYLQILLIFLCAAILGIFSLLYWLLSCLLGSQIGEIIYFFDYGAVTGFYLYFARTVEGYYFGFL